MKKFKIGYFIEVEQEGCDSADASNRAIINLGFLGVDGVAYCGSKTIPAVPGCNKNSPLLDTEVTKCRLLMAAELEANP